MDKKTLLTPAGITALKAGEWASDRAPRGEGRLLARRLSDGVMLYYRYTKPDGQRDTLRVGPFDKSGRDGLTLAAAREKAAELRQQRKTSEGDIRVAWANEQRENDRMRRAKEAAEQAAIEATATSKSRTLGALLTAYADQLERNGKTSARSVRAELFHHVRDAWPTLWAAPLADVTADDLLSIVAAPADAGKLRQAEKVRAYLRASYAAGVKARHNAKALPTLRALRVTTNTARDLTPIEGANKSRNRALSLAELRNYWKRIRRVPDYAALRFHLLTGGQRVEQLTRVTQADYDADTKTIRLLDTKGRRATPREHHVPLIAPAADAMRDMHGGALGPHLFTVTAGQSGASYFSIRDRVRAVVEAMQTAGELPGGPFTPGDLRRTVETRHADAGVSRDVRAHLQSHGLGGVQERHYDRHDYLPQTRTALDTLHRLLTGTG
ncbi:MAG: tyrosine-type recombinase/integrase, partial [Rhodanobacteraceae bacterium]